LDYDPIERFGGVGADVDLSGDYLVVLQHPVTTEYELARSQVWETLHAVSSLNLPTIWFWPNVDAGSDGTSNGIRTFREKHTPARIHFFKHMDSLDFLRLAYHCRCLVGNSSVAIRECSYLGVPAVNVGGRQEGRDRGQNVIDVPHDRQAIERAVRQQVARPRYPMDTLYGDGRAGERIAELIAHVPLTFTKRLYEPDQDTPPIASSPVEGQDEGDSRRAA
jgi:UDP-N-acetylglucosamine 2-epimerase